MITYQFSWDSWMQCSLRCCWGILLGQRTVERDTSCSRCHFRFVAFILEFKYCQDHLVQCSMCWYWGILIGQRTVGQDTSFSRCHFHFVVFILLAAGDQIMITVGNMQSTVFSSYWSLDLKCPNSDRTVCSVGDIPLPLCCGNGDVASNDGRLLSCIGKTIHSVIPDTE